MVSFEGISQSVIINPDTLEPKIKHVDPVFEDLTTALGARKGDKEANVNFGYARLRSNHHIVEAQLEYEFAPMDNLGFEINIPFSLYVNNDLATVERPGNQMEFVQWASQYTFYSNPQKGISMALGFKNIFDISSPERESNNFQIQSINYYPFLVFGKNWRDKFFLLFSGGPELTQELRPLEWELGFNLNSNFHYGFSKKDHFIGLEINKKMQDGAMEMYIRPQLILDVGKDFIFGLAIGFPTGKEDEKINGFLRLAYQF